MPYCTSVRAQSAYRDYIQAAQSYLNGPRHDRNEWLDDLRAAGIFRSSALAWYRRYRRAKEKEKHHGRS